MLHQRFFGYNSHAAISCCWLWPPAYRCCAAVCRFVTSWYWRLLTTQNLMYWRLPNSWFPVSNCFLALLFCGHSAAGICWWLQSKLPLWISGSSKWEFDCVACVCAQSNWSGPHCRAMERDLQIDEGKGPFCFLWHGISGKLVFELKCNWILSGWTTLHWLVSELLPNLKSASWLMPQLELQELGEVKGPWLLALCIILLQ